MKTTPIFDRPSAALHLDALEWSRKRLLESSNSHRKIPLKLRRASWAPAAASVLRAIQVVDTEIAQVRAAIADHDRRALLRDRRELTPEQLADHHRDAARALHVSHLEPYVVEYLARHVGQGLRLVTDDGPVHLDPPAVH